MARQIIFTAKAAKPPATYSQAVKAAGLVFVSGTAPNDPATGAIKGTTIQEQTRQCLTNISAILEEAGCQIACAHSRLEGIHCGNYGSLIALCRTLDLPRLKSP